MALDVARQPRIPCACGCGTLIPARGSNGHPRRFYGHHAKRVQQTSDEKRFKVSQARQKDFEQKYSGGRSCRLCDEIKAPEEFVSSGKLREVCVMCFPRHNAVRQVMRTYKISEEEVLELHSRKECAICGSPAEHIDHDHESGKVRDRLCAACNRGLGAFQDDPELMRAAAAYVEHHREVLEDVC